MTALGSVRFPSRPEGQLSRLRRASWFNWMLLGAVVYAVGVFTLALSCHDDDTAAIACPICQVTAHTVLQVYTPQFEAVAPVSLVHYVAFIAPKDSITKYAFTIRNQSRAPPV